MITLAPDDNISSQMIIYKYLVANATLFYFFISQIGIETSTFIYSNFAWELHGGVDVKWSGCLLV